MTWPPGGTISMNFRDVLFGRTTRAKSIVPDESGTSDRIVEYWRQRWLANRINQASVLEAVGAHTLAYPVRHGARVVLPPLAGEDNQGLLFSDLAVRREPVVLGVAARPQPDEAPTPEAAAEESGGRLP